LQPETGSPRVLIDSHCHLEYGELGADTDAVIARARSAGVGAMLTISTRQDTFPTVRGIAERYPNVWCSVGIHPHEAGEQGQQSPDWLAEQAAHPKVIGIGETGLDYFYDNSPREAQRSSFRAHIAAARRTGLPLIVHTRDADDDTAAILTEEYRIGVFSSLIHCFTSSIQLAEKALELGFSISFSGIITFRSAEALRDVVKATPMDRLLVETDAPYLAPVPKRGRNNEPAFVVHTAAKVAELKGISIAEVERVTTENFFRLFGKADRSGVMTAEARGQA
jgi:TatD DNase family protein